MFELTQVSFLAFLGGLLGLSIWNEKHTHGFEDKAKVRHTIPKTDYLREIEQSHSFNMI